MHSFVENKEGTFLPAEQDSRLLKCLRFPCVGGEFVLTGYFWCSIFSLRAIKNPMLGCCFEQSSEERLPWLSMCRDLRVALLSLSKKRL